MDFSTKEAVEKYLPLMHELAIRIELVAQAFDGRLNLTPPYAREYAYFQFRRMCELIALGCLQLHGDLPDAQTKSTKKEWNAERIMNLLHRIHPYSFPQSLIRIKTIDGWNIQGNSNPNALTLSEFKTLYAECGHVLHRGTIRTVESSRDFKQGDYQKAVDWQSKIVDLMNEHLISRSNGKGMYMISMRTESGYPECSILDIVNPGELQVQTINLNVADNIIHSYVANTKL
ncbi:MAG: hypothetical protein IPN42_13340 [Methylococcaceae bacterium]|nr:hypothetical protein [Methylococcaceae bacterium]